MKKRRGAALAGAIILCSLIITVSLAVGVVFIDISANNIVRRIDNQAELQFNASFNSFVSNNGAKPDNTSKFTFEVYKKEDNNQIKALVAKNSGGTMVFYAIYNFEVGHEKVLAYQTSDFVVEYAPVFKLAGIGPFVA